DQASAVFQTDIGKVDGMARSHGAAAAKVQELHDQYAQLPPLVATQVTAPGLDPAIQGTKTFRQMLDDLNGRRVQSYIDVIRRNIEQTVRYGPGGQAQQQSLDRRWGGVYTHAAAGVLRDAAVYSPKVPAR